MLPSVPFILLGAWFFPQSSEHWYRRLLESGQFGPTIRIWEDIHSRIDHFQRTPIALEKPCLAGQFMSERQTKREHSSRGLVDKLDIVRIS